MGAFQYQALDKSGATHKGVIEADSERLARQMLRDQNLFPTEIHPLSKNQHTNKQKQKLSPPDLALFTRQLATLIAAGIPVEESLRGVGEQTDNDKIRQLIIGVRSKVIEGFSLAQAMAEYPNAFPELYCATVAAGEQTGRMDVVLEKLADYTENQQKTRQKIQQALIYPTLMLVVSISIIGFLLTFVVPKIIDVFRMSGQALPPMTQVLLAISHFAIHYGIWFIITSILAIIIFKKSLAKPNVLYAWHRFLLKLPIVSYLIRSINVARYIHTFSILFAAGVSVLETMRVCTSLVNNVVIKTTFDKATSRVREGVAINYALKETGFVGAMALHLIASGEKSGQISIMMARAAKHLDDEVKRLIDTALTLLEPMVILLMGGVVLFIVLATLLPIFSMEQLVS